MTEPKKDLKIRMYQALILLRRVSEALHKLGAEQQEAMENGYASPEHALWRAMAESEWMTVAHKAQRVVSEVAADLSTWRDVIAYTVSEALSHLDWPPDDFESNVPNWYGDYADKLDEIIAKLEKIEIPKRP